MVATFLHVRRTDPAVVRALVDRAAPESPDLEFKSEWWRDQSGPDGQTKRLRREEAAKDIAALANVLGGDIVIGIVGDGRTGTAARFADNPRLPADPKKELVELLRVTLTPAQVAETIEVEVISVPDSLVGTRSVAVVSVPPWPYGAVGVRSSGDPVSFTFPYRSGSHTRGMQMEDVIARAEAGRRATFIKLTALWGGGRPSVLFVGRATWRVSDEFNGDLPARQWHGYLEAVDDNTLAIHMAAIDAVREAANQMMVAKAARAFGRVAQGQVELDAGGVLGLLGSARALTTGQPIPDNPRLVVPLSMIEDAWVAGAPPVVHILLRGSVGFVENRWVVAR